MENELPGKHVNETVTNMEPPNQFEDINGVVFQTVGQDRQPFLYRILSNHLGLN